MKLNDYITDRRTKYFGKYLASWIITLIFALVIAFITKSFIIPGILIALTIISIPFVNYKYFKENYNLFPKKYLLFLLMPIFLIVIGSIGLYYEKLRMLNNIIALLGVNSIGIISTKIEEKLVKLNNITF